MNRKSHAVAVMGVLAASLLPACSTVSGLTTKLTDSLRVAFGKEVNFVVPASDQSIARYRKIQVEPGTRHQGSPVLVEYVERRIAGVEVAGQPYFNAAGANPVVRVRTDMVDISSVPGSFQEERVRCPGDGMIRTCKGDEGYRYNVSCRSLTMQATGELVAADAQTGRALASRNGSVSVSDKVCSDDTNKSLKTPGQLEAEALTILADKLIGELIPAVERKPFDFQDDTKGLNDADAKLLGLANERAADGQVSAALRMYLDIANRNPQHGPLLFNVAFANHALGNYRSALDYYRRSSNATAGPIGKIEKYQPQAERWVLQGISSL